VAVLTVHLPNGFPSIKLQSYDAAGAHFGQPGYETDLLYLAGLIALSIAGSGPFSVDRYLRNRRASHSSESTSKLPSVKL
jgi:putative oxidoreductase